MQASEALAALWAEVFGEPPFIRAEPSLLARVLVEALPPAPPYGPAAGGPAIVVLALGRS